MLAVDPPLQADMASIIGLPEAAGTRRPELTLKVTCPMICAGIVLLASFENALPGRSRPNCTINDHRRNFCPQRAAGMQVFFKSHI